MVFNTYNIPDSFSCLPLSLSFPLFVVKLYGSSCSYYYTLIVEYLQVNYDSYVLFLITGHSYTTRSHGCINGTSCLLVFEQMCKRMSVCLCFVHYVCP